MEITITINHSHKEICDLGWYKWLTPFQTAVRSLFCGKVTTKYATEPNNGRDKLAISVEPKEYEHVVKAMFRTAYKIRII